MPVLYVSQADMIHAAILSNFLYGALLLARAPGELAIGAGSSVWVAVTGAVGHFCHASLLPAGEEPDGVPTPLLMLDIVLVFASLFAFTLAFPRASHLIADSVGGLIGL